MANFPKDINIAEGFDNPTGSFDGYDAYDPDQRKQLHKQKHINLRNFDPTIIKTEIRMIHLDRLTMRDLEATTMEDLEGLVKITTGEDWTPGDLITVTDRNNVWGLSLNCPDGIIETTSIG